MIVSGIITAFRIKGGWALLPLALFVIVGIPLIRAGIRMVKATKNNNYQDAAFNNTGVIFQIGGFLVAFYGILALLDVFENEQWNGFMQGLDILTIGALIFGLGYLMRRFYKKGSIKV